MRWNRTLGLNDVTSVGMQLWVVMQVSMAWSGAHVSQGAEELEYVKTTRPSPRITCLTYSQHNVGSCHGVHLEAAYIKLQNMLSSSSSLQSATGSLNAQHLLMIPQWASWLNTYCLHA